MEKFWVVWIESDGFVPCIKYATPEEAIEEAERLLNRPQYKGRKVYILELISYGYIPEVPIVSIVWQPAI